MGFFSNLFGKKPAKKQANTAPQPSPQLSREQEQRKWCLSIERIGEIAKQLYKTSVSESYEEQLDWAINFGFRFYSSICFIRHDLSFATAFLDWYKYFLKHDWQAPHDFDEALIAKFVNGRFSSYQNILQNPFDYVENEQRLEDLLFRFILNDRAGTTFASEEIEIPFTEMLSLKRPMSTVYIETLEKTKVQCDYVIGSSFYIQYTGDH